LVLKIALTQKTQPFQVSGLLYDTLKLLFVVWYIYRTFTYML